MKNYYFFNTIRKTIVQFLNSFSDIKIARYAENGKTIRKYVKVPLKLAVKEKVYYWLNERKDDEILPIITTYVSGIDYATDRKVNSFGTFTSSCDLDNNTAEVFKHPIPYNLSFTMNIWSLHMADMDQILEQILPFFSPHIFIRISLDSLNTTFDAKVIFRSATPEISNEMSDLDYRVVNYSLDFEVQSWLFTPSSDSGLIKKIYGSYFTDQTVFNNYIGNSTSTFSSGASGGINYDIRGSIDDEGELNTKYQLYELN